MKTYMLFFSYLFALMDFFVRLILFCFLLIVFLTFAALPRFTDLMSSPDLEKKKIITYEQPQYCYILITVASWTT